MDVATSAEPDPPVLVSAVLRPLWDDRRHLALMPGAYVRDLLLGRGAPGDGGVLEVAHLGGRVRLEVVRRAPGSPDAVVAADTDVHVVPALPPSLHAAASTTAAPASVTGFLRAALSDSPLAPTVLVLTADARRARAPARAAAAAAAGAGAAVFRFAAAALGGALGPKGVRAALDNAFAAARAAAPAVLIIDGSHVLAPAGHALRGGAVALSLRSAREAEGAFAVVLCGVPGGMHPLALVEADNVQSLPDPPGAPDAARMSDVAGVSAWASVSASVGGSSPAKLALRRALEWRRRRHHTFARLGVSSPAGVLLYGPPGTGKTLLARSAASAAGFRLISLDAGRIARGEVGASERALASAFATARREAPCVLFIDEVDAIFAGGSGADGRVVSVLAREIDAAGPDVAVVAATNRPWRVAGSLVRPGRFDACVETPLPDPEGRAEVARVCAGKMGIDGAVADALRRVVRAGACEGFSGADIAGACRRAAMRAIGRGREVTNEDVVAAFGSTTRSVTREAARKIADWKQR